MNKVARKQCNPTTQRFSERSERDDSTKTSILVNEECSMVSEFCGTNHAFTDSFFFLRNSIAILLSVQRLLLNKGIKRRLHHALLEPSY